MKVVNFPHLPIIHFSAIIPAWFNLPAAGETL
jgi:hypothetical protein